MEKGCPNCGRMVQTNLEKCPFCNYDFNELSEVFKKYESQRNPEIRIPKYAGFIKRTVANMFDSLFLLIIFLVINFLYLYFVLPSTLESFDIRHIQVLDYFKLFFPIMIMPLVYFLYCVFMQSSRNMATLGEKLLGIEIVDEDENPLSFSKAFIRNLARILDTLTLGIGYLMIIFTSKKQSLSDVVTHTYATNKITDENYNNLFYSGWFKRLLAFVFDIIILRLIVLGYTYLNTYLLNLKVDSEFIPAVTFTKYALFALVILIVLFYFPYMDSHKGATFGKMAFSLKVRDIYGEKIDFMRAVGRYILFGLELVLIPAGLLLVLVTPRKQTLKDIMSKTVVTR